MVLTKVQYSCHSPSTIRRLRRRNMPWRIRWCSRAAQRVVLHYTNLRALRRPFLQQIRPTARENNKAPSPGDELRLAGLCRLKAGKASGARPVPGRSAWLEQTAWNHPGFRLRAMRCGPGRPAPRTGADGPNRLAVRRVDDFGHLENRQKHADGDAADGDAEEDDEQWLDQGGEAPQGGFDFVVEEIRNAFEHVFDLAGLLARRD